MTRQRPVRHPRSLDRWMRFLESVRLTYQSPKANNDLEGINLTILPGARKVQNRIAFIPRGNHDGPSRRDRDIYTRGRYRLVLGNRPALRRWPTRRVEGDCATRGMARGQALAEVDTRAYANGGRP